jgi:hypothetical protein
MRTNGFTNYNRILNKRLSRVILYGRKPEDLIDRRTILQRCVEEIGRVRDSDKSESGKLKISFIDMFKIMNSECTKNNVTLWR